MLCRPAANPDVLMEAPPKLAAAEPIGVPPSLKAIVPVGATCAPDPGDVTLRVADIVIVWPGFGVPLKVGVLTLVEACTTFKPVEPDTWAT